MSLEHQLLSLFFSFSYGIIISYLYNLFYQQLSSKKYKYIILLNVLFFLDIFLIYFILLIKINNGIINNYFLITLFLGFILFNEENKKIRVLCKKK